MYKIGIDIGGTTIKAGVFDEENNLIQSTFAPTNAGRPVGEMVSDICDLAKSAVTLSGLDMSECVGAGVCSPGICNSDTGRVYNANNVGFDDVPLADLISKKLGLPVTLLNDADAAAYGEVVSGSAKGKKSVLYIGIGTGIGAGLIIDGKIYAGCGYGGIEAGHMMLSLDGEKCTCGKKGCFEAYASATALIRQAEKAAKENTESLLNKEKITGKSVFDAAKTGDETAKSVVEKYTYYLSEGIVSLINIFDPEAVIIGGGISKAGEMLVSPVREFVKENIFGAPDRTPPEILTGALYDMAGLYGAAAAFREFPA